MDALRTGLPDLAELDQAECRAQERLALARTAETAAEEASLAAERRLAEIRPRWEQLQQLRETALALEAELKLANHQAAAAAPSAPANVAAPFMALVSTANTAAASRR